MQLEQYLVKLDNLRAIALGMHQLNLGRWKKSLCSKIGNDEVSTNETLMPLDFARHSFMHLIKSFDS